MLEGLGVHVRLLASLAPPLGGDDVWSDSGQGRGEVLYSCIWWIGGLCPHDQRGCRQILPPPNVVRGRSVGARPWLSSCLVSRCSR